MNQPRITRRQVFKASAFGAEALPLPAVTRASVAAAPSQEAQAATVELDKLAVPQPTFNPIASTTAFGAPTDISSGWDGTLWAIDASGAPHLYDPIANQWNPHGEGIEAATAIGNTLYVFRGGQYITVDLSTNTVTSGPSSVATTWPSLPDSFKLRLTGAANVGGKLVLFSGGWYVSADGSIPRAKLTSITSWPQTPNWADGLIDAVYFDETALIHVPVVRLLRGNECITVWFEDPTIPNVIEGPTPVSEILPPSLATLGIDAATYYPIS